MNREQAFANDGMKHYYSTCPRCRNIVSDENIVFVDGEKMCRECMESAGRKTKMSRLGPAHGSITELS